MVMIRIAGLAIMNEARIGASNTAGPLNTPELERSPGMSEHTLDGAAPVVNPSENQTEEWRPAVGYEGWYDVSNLGRVRRALNAPTCRASRPGRILITTRPDPSTGYARVTLNAHGNVCREQVHRLVGRAFLPPGVARQHINHKDGDKMNNRAENLEWVTPRENTRHAWRMGLARPHRGETHPRAKLCERDVRVIRDAAARGVPQRAMSTVFNVTEAMVSSIVREQSWRHLTPTTEVQNVGLESVDGCVSGDAGPGDSLFAEQRAGGGTGDRVQPEVQGGR